MKLSVIIACYNAEDTIAEQLEALTAQQWNHPWEVIIVDNGSTDNSIKIVEAFKDKIENLFTIEATAKKGAPYARNEGVKKCSGEFVAFVDADDVVGVNWLKNLGNALLENDFIACRMEWAKLNDLNETELMYRAQTEGLIVSGISNFFPYAGAGTLALKKSIHNEIGGFDEEFRYAEDMDYCCRIQDRGYSLVFLSGAPIHIRSRNTNYQSFKQEMKWAEYDIYLSKKFEKRGIENYKIKKNIHLIYTHLRKGRQVFNSENKGLWIAELGRLLGRLKGSLNYKLIKHKLIKPKLGHTIADYNF